MLESKGCHEYVNIFEIKVYSLTIGKLTLFHHPVYSRNAVTECDVHNHLF